MKLYYHDESRAIRPRIALEEAGLDYELARVDMHAGEHRAPEYRALHPLGQLPVLTIGDTAVFESVAICLHIADLAPGLAPPPRSPERALYYQWCAYTSGSLEPAIYAAHARGEPPRGIAPLNEVLAALDDALRGQDTLLRRGFSAADVLVGSTLLWIRGAGVELPPEVARYTGQLSTRPAFRTVLRN